MAVRHIVVVITLIISSMYLLMPALSDPSAVKVKTHSNIKKVSTNKKLADIYISQNNSKTAKEIIQKGPAPPCPECHSTISVVPIVYANLSPAGGYITNYGNDEFEDAVRVPTSPMEEPPNQWYCLACHTPFFHRGTGSPIYEHIP